MGRNSIIILLVLRTVEFLSYFKTLDVCFLNPFRTVVNSTYTRKLKASVLVEIGWNYLCQRTLRYEREHCNTLDDISIAECEWAFTLLHMDLPNLELNRQCFIVFSVVISSRRHSHGMVHAMAFAL